MTGLDYDGRRELVRKPGAPRPPADLEAELMALGAEVGPGFERDPRYLVLRARYEAWKRDQGYEDEAHGSEAPANAYDEEEGDQ